MECVHRRHILFFQRLEAGVDMEGGVVALGVAGVDRTAVAVVAEHRKVGGERALAVRRRGRGVQNTTTTTHRTV